jgi:putative acetyltransferase
MDMTEPSEIVIRAQEPADVVEVTELLNQPRAVWGTLQTPFTSVASREKRYADLDAQSTRLVATLDGKVVGSAGMQRFSQHRRSHAATLGMAVHDAYAGRGAGRAMLAALVDLADRWWNIRRLELDVYADNARAIGLYERFGFEREGLLRAYAWRDGGYVDTLVMARLRP